MSGNTLVAIGMVCFTIICCALLLAGCTYTGSGGTHIYKLDHQLETVNGVQTYTQEVVRVPR